MGSDPLEGVAVHEINRAQRIVAYLAYLIKGNSQRLEHRYVDRCSSNSEFRMFNELWATLNTNGRKGWL